VYRTGSFGDFIEDVLRGAGKAAADNLQKKPDKPDKKKESAKESKSDSRSAADKAVDAVRQGVSDEKESAFGKVLFWGVVAYLVLKEMK
jgi:hypothetical protein